MPSSRMPRHESRELSAAWVGERGWPRLGRPLDNTRFVACLCGLAIGAIGRPDALCFGPGLAWAARATIAASTDARRVRRRGRLGARTTQYEDGRWPAEHPHHHGWVLAHAVDVRPEPMYDAHKLNESSTILPPRLQFAQTANRVEADPTTRSVTDAHSPFAHCYCGRFWSLPRGAGAARRKVRRVRKSVRQCSGLPDYCQVDGRPVRAQVLRSRPQQVSRAMWELRNGAPSFFGCGRLRAR